MKLKRLKVFAILTVMIIILFTGCERSPTRYYGPYADLANVTMNNVLGIEPVYGSIAPMDKDDFGRQMFVYLGRSKAAPYRYLEGTTIMGSQQSIIAICVSQKSDSKYVYYYSDDCFLIYAEDKIKYESVDRDTEKGMANLAWDLMSDEDLEALKEKNYWGKPLDETRWERTRINPVHIESSVKDKSKLAFCDEIGYKIPSSGTPTFQYLTTDKYGRCINCFSTSDKCYAVMFYPKGNYDYIEITDRLDYQDDMKEFKAQNNWGEPIKK
jgi:hypothetical protein